MTAADQHLSERRKYLAVARTCGNVQIATRLRTLATNCLLMASDPTDTTLRQRYVENCRDFAAYMKQCAQ